MRTNLLETYSRQLKVAEAYVAKTFDGKEVSNNTKLATAVLLDNTNRWITESLNTEIGAATRGDLGAWKKFCLNLTNIAVPSLIANDLVIVHPMTSYSGSVAYLKYVAGATKGTVTKGDEFNSVFGLGNMTAGRMNYTAQVVVEDVVGVTDEEGNTTYSTVLVPVAGAMNGFTYKIDGEYTDTLKAGKVAYRTAELNAFAHDENTGAVDAIPSIVPKMERIALVAEPRRIAVKYDQITAFQAKTDYGFSLDKQIAEQACGELAYEIDSEIVDMLYKAAKKDEVVMDKLTWSKTLPVGVSKFEHYNGFLEVIEEAKAIIYDRTKRFHPNYMVIGSGVLPVLKFVNGFSAAKAGKMNGPYKVGEIEGMSVYVSPSIDRNDFFMGLNGSDMMSSAGVYAPYMAIVPTQLLGTPDGALAQGFSTWYAKALLNEALLVAGKIAD